MIAFTTLLRAAFVLLFITGPTAAHEGHDHGQPANAPVASAAPRMEAHGGPFELVAELRSGELVVYLDRMDTNEPIADATVAVETPAGSETAAAKPDNTYRLPAPWTKDNAVDLIFTVTLGDSVEVLSGTLPAASNVKGADRKRDPATLTWTGIAGLAIAVFILVAGFGAVQVLRRKHLIMLMILATSLFVPNESQAHEGESHDEPAAAPIGTSDAPQRMADGTLFVPKPVQRLLAIRTAVAAMGEHAKAIELPGRVMPDPNASGFVQASVSGRLSPPEGGFAKLGTAVKDGDVLAYVTPPFAAIDVSDMRQKAGEIDQQITIVEQRVDRYAPLLKTGAVPKVTYDEAVLELKGLRERRAALDKTRREPERLIAPVAGVIASANAVSGQIAETNAVVFQIIDPSRLWIEALTFALLPDAGKATARTADGRSLPLRFEGAGLTDRSQAIPVHFSIEGDTSQLRVGQLVTVLAATGEVAKGLALPRTATLRDSNGQTIVFEHVGAERFVRRAVRVAPLDADRVIVLDGIAAGARIVVAGTELLNQVR